MIKALLRGALAAAGAIALSYTLTIAPLQAVTDAYPDNSVVSSCARWEAITPADGVKLAHVPKALWVGTTGNINMAGDDGILVVWPSVPVGMLAARPTVVNATLTTASGLIACVR